MREYLLDRTDLLSKNVNKSFKYDFVVQNNLVQYKKKIKE